MSNVVPLNGLITTLDLEARHVLAAVQEENLEGVVILGYTQDGKEFFSSTYADGGTVLWLLERCKKLLLEDDDCRHE